MINIPYINVDIYFNKKIATNLRYMLSTSIIERKKL